jgi:hypothetical protein
MVNCHDNINELSCSVNYGEFLHGLTNFQFPDKDSTPLDLISVVMMSYKCKY